MVKSVVIQYKDEPEQVEKSCDDCEARLHGCIGTLSKMICQNYVPESNENSCKFGNKFINLIKGRNKNDR